MLLLKTNQWFICYRLQRNAFSIYLPYFTNDLSKEFLVFAGKQLRIVRNKWNFRAGCIEQVHCGYISIRVRLSSKKKTRRMPGTNIYYISFPSNGC